MPAGTELTQLSLKRSQEGGLGKRAETGAPEGMVGRHLEGLEGRTAAYCKCLTVRTPEARLPWARAGRRLAWETDVHKCSAVRAGFPVWVSGAVTDISFLTDYVVITVITFWCPLLEIFIASWVILLIPGKAPKGLWHVCLETHGQRVEQSFLFHVKTLL